MRAKKVIASFVIGALLLTSYTLVQAEYPLHPTTNDHSFFKDGKIEGVSAFESNAEAAKRKFTVGGKEYLLVDSDSEGRCFIIENQKTGGWSSGRKYYAGADANLSSTDKNNWSFDYTNENSIAYYLDNEYRNSMPTEIKEHLVRYDWTVEGDYPMFNNKQSELEATEWFKEKVKNNQPYKTSGYVSLMSATEYDAYKGIIGTADLNESDSTAWWGILFRTPLTRLSGGSVESATYTGYSIGYTHRFDDNKNPTDDINLACMPSLTYPVYYMRPCFWVDANFFEEVKVGDFGDIIADKLKALGYNKLRKLGYTAAELEKLGFEATWYGLYPDHPKTNNRRFFRDGAIDVSASASNAEAIKHKFKIGEKEYLLIDKDDDGKYFILENQKTNGQFYYSGSDANVSSTDKDNWSFNYTNEKSIAYYLDNAYRKEMPNAIQDHLVKYDWVVEGDYPYFKEAQQAQFEATDWFKEKVKNNQPYKTSGYVSLMSATEYSAYKDVIGTADLNADDSTAWWGFMFRTPLTRNIGEIDDSEYKGYSPGYTHRFNDDKTPTDTISYACMPSLTYNIYYMRPCFWVDSDFFKAVHLNIDNLGEIVIEEIKSMGYENLVNLYTKEELEKIGYEPDKVPTAANVTVTMQPYENAIVGCSYTYDSVVDSPEKDSVIIWSAADSLNGEYKEIYRGTEKTIVIPNGYSGKNIKASVVPFDSDGRSGVRAEDCTPVQVTSAKGVYIGNAEIKDGSATLDIYNVGNDKKIINVYKTEYNSDGRLVGITADEYTIFGGESVKPVVSDIKDNYTYQIMVWEKDGDHPLFYMCK